MDIKMGQLHQNYIKIMFDTFRFGSGYCSNGPVEGAVLFNIALGTLIYLLSKISKEYSWVDRIWTILPSLYTFHFLYHPLACSYSGYNQEISIRSIIVTVLIFIWGCRLTFNFWRKGGYKKGGEDHRWPYMRKKWGGIRMELLLFFFISYYQLFLILWFTLPVYYVSKSEINGVDIALIFAAFAFLLLQKQADDEQYHYQTQKRLLKLNNQTQQLPAEYKVGFNTAGLFKYSRHPNFLGELGFWWVIALFSLKDLGPNISLFGAIQLTLLFQGSTRLTQQISALKYPLYRIYQKNVGMILPNLRTPPSVLDQKNE